jgi:hypothetical protein
MTAPATGAVSLEVAPVIRTIRSLPSKTPDATNTFLELLPKIETHARIAFRHVTCPHTRLENVAETVALAWKWYLRLNERGKDVTLFPMAFAAMAAKAVKAGRRLCGQERAKDVMSPIAQRRYGFVLEALWSIPRVTRDHRRATTCGPEMRDVVAEQLRDNTESPIPDQVAFLIDWPQFVDTLSERDRELAAFLALGHSALHAAAQFGLSPGRVTQIRQRWCCDWRRSQDPALIQS